jgi:GNAT superfamily N-acetyltransferase
MNNIIVKNLFEYWTVVGSLNQSLRQTPYFKYNPIQNSDWPKRVFELENSAEALDAIIELLPTANFPARITTSGLHTIQHDERFQFNFGLQNMAMSLNDAQFPYQETPEIHQVVDTDEILAYAHVATVAFKYHFNADVFANVLHQSEQVKAFVYVEEGEVLGCGTLFIDSNNVAGLHTIGTLPAGRNKGIGRKITERLLTQAQSEGCSIAVLNASVMGEPIYAKLGFKTYGELQTFSVKE